MMTKPYVIFEDVLTCGAVGTNGTGERNRCFVIAWHEYTVLLCLLLIFANAVLFAHMSLEFKHRCSQEVTLLTVVVPLVFLMSLCMLYKGICTIGPKVALRAL